MCDRTSLDRYLLEGLPPAAEERLRAHLRTCAACRDHYDQTVRLLRGLRGAPQGPTPAEEARLERLVLARVGLAQAPPTAPGGSALDALVWASWPRLAGLAGAVAVLVLALVGALLWGGSEPIGPGTPYPVLEAGAPGPVLEGVREVRLARGGAIRLFAGARARLSGEQRLELEQGVAWCRVERGRGEFLVRTPLAEVRVLGTSFVVEARAAETTEVRVIAGEVEVSAHRKPGRVRLRAGERSTVLPDRPPAEAARYDSRSDREAWERARGEAVRALERGGREADKVLHRVEKELRDHLSR